jgi:hypothetical protein
VRARDAVCDTDHALCGTEKCKLLLFLENLPYNSRLFSIISNCIYIMSLKLGASENRLDTSSSLVIRGVLMAVHQLFSSTVN